MPSSRKHFLCLLLAAAVLTPSVAWGQRLMTDTLLFRPPYADLRPVTCTNIHTLDSSGRCHGVSRIEGSDVVRKAGYYNEQHYSENRTYDHGVLHGPFSQTFRHTGHGSATDPYKVRRRWSASGTFVRGHPDGIWSFALESNTITGGETSTTHYSYTLVFDNGVLCSLDDNQGHRLLFHTDGTVSGAAVVNDGGNRTLHLSHSVITDCYQGADGSMLPLPSTLDALLSDKLSSFARADSGYAVDYGEWRIVQVSRCSDIINRYIRLHSLDTALTASPLTRVGLLRVVTPVSPDAAFDYYVQTPGSADALLQDGFFERRHRKYFLNSTAEQRIRRHLTTYHCDLLAHKLNILTALMDAEPWDSVLADCRAGRSPLLDMVAARWHQPGFEGQCDESAALIDRAFRPLCPLRGFCIVAATYEPYKGLEAMVEFHVIGPDSVQYRSVVLPVCTTPSGHLLVGRLDPAAYRTVPNVWDTIAAREQWLNERHRQIIEKVDADPDELREYCDEYETRFNDTSILPEVRIEDLRYLEELQEPWL